MLLSFLSMQAFAYEEGGTVYVSPAERPILPLNTVQVSTWAELRDTVNVAIGATTIELIDDILLPAGVAGNAIIIPPGSDITLTGGHTLTRTAAGQRHFIVDGTLTLENVTISGNYPTITGNHGGIEVRAGGTLYMEDGSAIRDNRHTSNTSASGILVAGAGATFTMNGGEISYNSTLSITAGSSSGSASVFVNNGAVFTMNGGVIRYNTGRFGGGVRIGQTAEIGGDNRMYMHGGEIYNNTAFFGGGVNLEFGTFTMTDGTIRDNIATAFQNNTELALTPGRGGGGVFIQNSGIFNMEGGTISGNRSYTHGGGVMSGTPAANQFNMTGGTIFGNTADDTGGGVRMTNGVFTMGSGLLDDGTVTTGTISGNTARNDGGGIWLGTGTAIANARLNLTANVGTISNNTATYGNGGGIFTVANNGYPAALSPLHYPNILATTPFAVTFSGNVAGGGRFAPPLNPEARPFGTLLNNYDINYVGENPEAYIIFFLNGGNISGNPASVSFPIPLGGTIDIADIPVPPDLNRPLYTFLGWIQRSDTTNTLLSAEDIAEMTFEERTTFDAQWQPLSPIIITYLAGTNGRFAGGATSATETLVGSGGYPTQVPTPIANAGFRFVGWSRDGSRPLLSRAALMALFIDADTTFTAHWERISIQPPPPPPPPPPSRQAYLIGTETGYIRPNASITRAEVATIFFRLIDDTDRATNWIQTNPYSDVEINHWFNNAVSTMTQMGIFQGRPDGTFAPTEAITRAELATAVARFMDVMGLTSAEEDLFSDIYAHWANLYINVVGAHNWARGPYGHGGPFYPDRPITRAETAAFINRIFERLPETPADLLPDMITWPDNANVNEWYYLYLQSASNSYMYERKPDGIHERWIASIPVRNWAALERPDSTPESLWE